MSQQRINDLNAKIAELNAKVTNLLAKNDEHNRTLATSENNDEIIQTWSEIRTNNKRIANLERQIRLAVIGRDHLKRKRTAEQNATAKRQAAKRLRLIKTGTKLKTLKRRARRKPIKRAKHDTGTSSVRFQLRL